MKRIGSRSHPLMVVNYLAWVIVGVAAVVVAIEQPTWPTSPKSWAFMLFVGVFGGLMVRISSVVHMRDPAFRHSGSHYCQEFLLTAGISSDRSSASTVMIYSQVLWALAIDRVIWHVSMNIWTFVGVGGVVGSLIMVSLAKEIPALRRKTRQDYQAVPATDVAGSTVYEIDLEDMYDEEEDEDAL